MTCRPAFERISAIWADLCEGYLCNANTLARKFGTTAKTIHRDINYLRKRLGASIQYDALAYSFVLDKKTLGKATRLTLLEDVNAAGLAGKQ